MADYSESKKFGTKTYPVESFETSSLLKRCEKLMTPGMLKSRFLKGIDVTDYLDDELKDQIIMAINDFELMAELSVTRVQDKQRIPFDRDHYKAFVYFKTNHGPIQSIEEVLIESSNGESIYRLPPDWIEMGLAHKRQVNLIPILSIFGAAGLRDGQPSNAGLIFLQAVNNFQWLPAFYSVKYTHGLSNKDGLVPVIVNNIIGAMVAIEILSKKQATFLYNSTSTSQDGISQSASGPGPQTYAKRIEDLETKKEANMKKLKAIFHQKYYMSNI